MNRYRILPPLAAAALAALLPLHAAAETGQSYLGVQYSNVTFAPDAFDEEWENTAVTLRGGRYVSDVVSLEGRFGVGLSDDTQELTFQGVPMDVSIELDSLIGVYGVAHLPLGDSFRLYGAAGWTEVTITTAARAGLSQASDEGSEDGFSWGVGGQVDLGETVAVSVEYMQYLDEKDIAVDSLGLGIELFF